MTGRKQSHSPEPPGEWETFGVLGHTKQAGGCTARWPPTSRSSRDAFCYSGFVEAGGQADTNTLSAAPSAEHYHRTRRKHGEHATGAPNLGEGLRDDGSGSSRRDDSV